MNKLRDFAAPLPARMEHLSIDDRGYPVPWFVPIVDGKPEFRAADPTKLLIAVKSSRCWICGGMLGRFRAFVIGPMGAMNRINSEPPSHRECAEFAMRVCPFIIHPQAKRREANMPVHHDPTGLTPENPGVYLEWITRDARVFNARGSLLFELGDPQEVIWFSAGAPVTRETAEQALREATEKLLAQAGEDTINRNAVMLRAHAMMQYLPS